MVKKFSDYVKEKDESLGDTIDALKEAYDQEQAELWFLEVLASAEGDGLSKTDCIRLVNEYYLNK